MQAYSFLRYITLAALVLVIASCSRTMDPEAGAQPYKSSGQIAVDFYIPQDPVVEPNDATLEYYFYRYRYDRILDWAIAPSQSPTKLRKGVKHNDFLRSQMEDTAIVSYLYQEDGTLIYDEVSPDDRFGNLITDSTLLMSHSVAKSWTSYILGHAICRGYIEDIDARIDDYPAVEGTLYENQKIIDFLNMRTGDQQHVTFETGVKPTGRWYNNYPISDFAENELKGTRPGSRSMNYHSLNVNVILNYIIFKAGDEAKAFFSDLFQDHIGIGAKVRFNRLYGPIEKGTVRGDGHAARYDFLRIANAMLKDWNENTCVGDYLKEVIDRSIPNTDLNREPSRYHSMTTHRYGGFFYSKYVGMRSRNILGMDGYGGQSVVIDFDNDRIVSVNAIHSNYDWFELVYEVIKHGDIQK